jgi:hypothetical protein
MTEQAARYYGRLVERELPSVIDLKRMMDGIQRGFQSRRLLHLHSVVGVKKVERRTDFHNNSNSNLKLAPQRWKAAPSGRPVGLKILATTTTLNILIRTVPVPVPGRISTVIVIVGVYLEWSPFHAVMLFLRGSRNCDGTPLRTVCLWGARLMWWGVLGARSKIWYQQQQVINHIEPDHDGIRVIHHIEIDRNTHRDDFVNSVIDPETGASLEFRHRRTTSG